MSLRTGKILEKKYRILKRLGAGRFGPTYLAETVEPPNQKVIIKELPDQRDKAETSIIERSSLEHSGTPHFLEGFFTRRKYYEVFEFVSEVTSLRELIDESAPLSEDKVISFGLQLSETLRTLHSLGLVHRDIKPSNILVTPDQQIKLIDFGIAAKMGTHHSFPTGTVGYAAPEQYHDIVSPQSDIYSLGVVLYEMLTGRRSKGKVSFTPIREISPEVFPELASLVQKCLELGRKDRPSASEVYDTLLSMRYQRSN